MILTESNLLRLGIYDDCYNFYRQVIETYYQGTDLYLNTVVFRDYLNIGDFSKIDLFLRKDVKKLFDEFLLLHTNVFTDLNRRIYMSQDALKVFRFFEFNHDILNLKVRYSTFKEFLWSVEFCIVRKLHKIITYEKSLYPFDMVQRELKKRIDEKVAKSRTHTVISNPTYDVFPIKKIYLYKNLHQILCNTENHNIVPIKSMIKFCDDNKYIKIPTHYCRDCKKTFIGNETLKLYEKEYGMVLLQREAAKENSNVPGFIELNCESQLHKSGYNVIEGNLAEKEREALLKALIDNNLMTKFEIIRDLENSIKLFQHRTHFSSAVKKWKHDLLFVAELA